MSGPNDRSVLHPSLSIRCRGFTPSAEGHVWSKVPEGIRTPKIRITNPGFTPMKSRHHEGDRVNGRLRIGSDLSDGVLSGLLGGQLFEGECVTFDQRKDRVAEQERVRAVVPASGEAATRAAALIHGDGTYVATPARSWQPAAFKVQPRAVAVKP